MTTIFCGDTFDSLERSATHNSRLTTHNDSTNIQAGYAGINPPFNEQRIYFNQPQPLLQLVETLQPCVELVCTAQEPGHIFALSTRK